MPKRPARDNTLTYAIGAALIFLVAGFFGAWYYVEYAQKKSHEVNYLTLPSVAISRDGHSIRAGLAIRTSGTDADWASSNKPALERIMQSVLMDADPEQVRTAGGIAALQDSMREAGNGALNSNRIREVLVTDMLVSEGDS